MSYILDALRKSDQQRQRGQTPTLATAPLPLSRPQHAPARHGGLSTWLVAGTLVILGILIGWLRPWQAPAPSLPQAAAPLTQPAPEAAPSQNPTPAPPPIALAPAITPPPAAPGNQPADPQPPLPVNKTRQAPAASPPPELPPLNITVHAWAADPAERLAGINQRMLHEGDDIAPGLKLEKITPEGIVLNYRGQRIRREVR